MGFSFKKFISNPLQSVGDVIGFGIPTLLRETGIAPKLAMNINRVNVATFSGIVAGGASGGVPGAIVGGASGFGRGVSAAVHGESLEAAAGGGAKWGAITGGVTGAVRNTGAAGFVRSQIFSGTPTASGALPSVKSLAGFAAAGTFLKSLVPQNLGLPDINSEATRAEVSSGFDKIVESYIPGGPVTPPTQYISPPTSLVSVSPLATPTASPAVIDVTPEAARSISWLWLVVAGVVAFVLLRKKAKWAR